MSLFIFDAGPSSAAYFLIAARPSPVARHPCVNLSLAESAA
jgi:hypothetical protein